MTHIYVFSDESGVFDQINNDTFVYAGTDYTEDLSDDFLSIKILP